LEHREEMNADKPGWENIPILLVELKGEEISKISALIAQTTDLIHSQNGTVLHIVSAIVIATFDPGKDPGSEYQLMCEITAQKIHHQIGTEAKILYGLCKAIDGNFSSPHRIHVGPFIPNLRGLMHQLGNLRFGASEKLSGQAN
jgi:hypothetical protein